MAINDKIIFEQETDKGTVECSRNIHSLEELVISRYANGMSLSDKSALMEKSGITGQQKTSLILSEYPDWEDDAKEAGVSNEVFVEFKIATSDLAGDKDGNGKTIPGSKKNKVLSAINAMDVDASVKDALYFASGYSANTIYDAPWR